MKIAAPTLILSLLAAPALAFTPERAALMVDAIRANECAMASDQAEAALGPLGLDAVEVQAFVDTLYGAGLVSISADMSVLSLQPILCNAGDDAALAMITQAFAAQETSIEVWRPEFEPARGAELIATLRGLDCVLTEDAAQDALPPLGFTPIETRDIVAVLVDSDMASVTEDGSELRLTEATCAADPESDAPALAALLAAWDETHPAPGVVIEERASE
ncbi:hypothetical protein [Pararhodobacter zhoushanensis]|uniref:Uncharacterized protein n=1 Tax=Pararhodobacter zhoushanensis TaxID=2479545 RepID=A0ABT3GZD5_9RHOB|nr:hypothetical protein [Pararhodobacter zhoushanensis]MCW1932921.1 hypothetical protein [Pararhodobacter zhoushanensis]